MERHINYVILGQRRQACLPAKELVIGIKLSMPKSVLY